MKRQSFKIYALALILSATVLLGASCTAILPGTQDNTCSHKMVAPGDCTTRGACVSCGELVGELGAHSYSFSVVDPTCSADGYTEYVCSVCADSYRDNATDATAHDFGEWIFNRHPTATESGEMYRECSVCKVKETEEVPPHKHTLADGDAQALSCTTDGWEAYQYCTQCEYSNKNVIKATGHAWDVYTSNGDSTHTSVCANDGTHVLTAACSGGDSSGSALPVCDFCHTEYEFAARYGNSSYGYYALGEYATYGEGMQRLYKDFTKAAEEFYADNDDVNLNDGYYEIGEFYLDNYGLPLNAGCAVWKIFYVSNPLYYWLDATVVSRGNTLILTISEDYAKAADRRAADAAIKAMTYECSLLIEEGMTDIEKTVVITEYIVSNMEYAYEADGVTPVDDMWAHCMAGFATEGLGVCESYAKTFMYLCLLNGVDCRMGSGYAGEPHAWNYVKLDGEWYGADLTWTDSAGDLAVYDYVGLSASEIFKDHTPHTSTELSSDFIYEAPELSNKSIELTRLSKNGEYVGIYKSVGDAFSAMTDENGEYEIYVGYYSFNVNAPINHVKATVTPNVKKLTITGRNEEVGEGYFDNNSVIMIPSNLILGSDVVLKNLLVDTESGGTVNMSKYTLTLAGDSVYVNSKIVGILTTCTLISETADMPYLFLGADVHRLNIENDGVVFGADSHIVYCNDNKIYYQNDADVDVDFWD